MEVIKLNRKTGSQQTCFFILLTIREVCKNFKVGTGKIDSEAKNST